MRWPAGFATALVITLAATPAAAQAPRPIAFGSSCSALIGLESPTSIVTYTIRHGAGTFVPPDSGPAPVSGRPPFNVLAEFCRAVVTVKPRDAAPFEIELWLPTETWTGRLWAAGREDPTSAMDFAAMAAWLARGAVVVSMRTPLSSSDAIPGAVHHMTTAAKSVTTAFFGQGPRWSYWVGCGLGADTGIAVAARFPDDFDGVLAGSPTAVVFGARPDLTRFATLHGKLLLFTGANLVAPAPTESIRIPTGSIRSLSPPASGACDPAAAPVMSAMATALQDWVERGIPPKSQQ